MSDNENAEQAVRCIEAVRGPLRRLPEKFPNFEPIDVALGALYGAHDLAQAAGMTPIEAVEWMRTAADVMEAQLMNAPRGAH